MLCALVPTKDESRVCGENRAQFCEEREGISPRCLLSIYKAPCELLRLRSLRCTAPILDGSIFFFCAGAGVRHMVRHAALPKIYSSIIFISIRVGI